MANVLLVDDESTVLTISEELLTYEGHHVVTAFDGMAAIERLQRESLPDVVILDLNMPGMDGLGVLEAMRAHDKLKNLPVIIITGTTLDAKGFPRKDLFQAVVEKPFDLMDVADKIQQLINA